MSSISIDEAILRDLLLRKEELVRSITAGIASGEWDQVMGAFDGLLVAIKRIEESLETQGRETAS
ncbi:MAG TPA: hypothetical protein VLM91_13975 [Candidatus Methylomirabilis sp.]|nr:hypothetical protein [Candidatus Methylomirabilis sp.]